MKDNFHHEGHEEHEVRNINHPNLRVLRAFVVNTLARMK